MQKLLYSFIFMGSAIIGTNAQTTEPTTLPRWKQYFELSLSAGNQQFASALSWSHLYGIGEKRRFRIGYGLRYTAYWSKNQKFITAPAKLTSKQEGPQVLFSETFEENLDTFQVSSSQANMINAAIYLQYDLNPKFQVGFNIDAIGFSFGKKANGHITSSLTGATIHPSAKPTSFNLLLVSDNDIGSLNSELYARYFFNKKWAVRAGVSFLFVEYRTINKDLLNNDRYRNKSLTGMIGIVYSPFK